MNKNEKGQILVTLLFIVAIAIAITSATVIVLFNIRFTTSRYSDGLNAIYIAQAGVENTFLQLVRNPYFSGETIIVGDGQATTQVTQGSPVKVVSTGTYFTSIKKLEANLVYNEGILTVQSIKEIF